MVTLKKALAVLLCAIVCVTLNVSVAAAPATTKVTVSSVDAMPGDTVVIDVEISNNPGIMAMAFTITYDSADLEYKSYSKGYLSNYTVKNHTDKGHVAFVNVENKNIATDGTIISLTFEVKKASKPGKHPITVANSNRDKHGNKVHNIFSDSAQNYIVPVVESGGITVAETCENSGHKYGEWNILQNADCTTTGLKNHTCVRCSFLEEVTIPITHDFEAEWTVDKVATPEEDGIMSRHCTKCDAVTDKITFSYEEIGGDDDNDDNSSDDNSSDNNSGDNSTDSDDNNSSDNTSSSDEPTTDNDSQDTSSNNSSSSTNADNSQNTPNKKPVINNTVGEKVPLKEVEKLEDYQQNIKPNLDNDAPTKAPQAQEPTTESDDEPATNSSDATIGAVEDTDNNTADEQEDEKPFFATTTGIIMIVLCALISIGIIVLGIVLITRNKKH